MNKNDEHEMKSEKEIITENPEIELENIETTEAKSEMKPDFDEKERKKRIFLLHR